MGLIPNIVVNENTSVRPETPYQCSKMEAEELLRDYYRNKGLPAVILRPSVVYGKGMVGELYNLVRFIKKGFLPHIGWGENLSPMVHVNDLVNACIKSLEKGKSGEIYIITSTQSHGMRELTESVKKALKAKPFEFTIPFSVAMSIAYLSEVLYKISGINPMITMESVRGVAADRRFSIAKAQRELDFVPKIDLDQCVVDAIEWLKEQKKI
jgi:nucleoside-diphosphate-sugar epimerase